MRNVVIVAYGRSAIARSGKKGALRELHPVDIGGLVLKGILEKKIPQLNPSNIEDVIVGCAQQDLKQGYNMARLISARAGVPDSVPAMTVNRFCSASLQAIALAAGQIESGLNDIIVAGGVESMTAVPMTYDRTTFQNEWLVENVPDQYMSMGLTAENVASRYEITRQEMDDLAAQSHKRGAIAQDAGKFDDEIIPLPGVDDEGKEIIFKKDQGIRLGTSKDSLAELKPCFIENGIVTAGNSSQTSDGAAFVVLMSETKANELGIKPIAKFIGYAVTGCEPGYMGLGPIYSVPKVMKNTGLSVNDMDVIEFNEAFAAQAIPCMRELGMDWEKVNPNGGAIAMGHPLGATGAVLTCKALGELKRTGGKYALITMCIGGGMGAAGIYEMC
ncbi:thiolase family protein [Clostridium sp. BSD9I1]|uniref:thiolase family protein n=1 Tax=Clostridium sp. BSD9I1 TaxID=2003589 RepID=UPI00164820E7|nr:thiolase family protein [Clostridium sp. BSD9I1]